MPQLRKQNAWLCMRVDEVVSRPVRIGDILVRLGSAGEECLGKDLLGTFGISIGVDADGLL